MTQAPAAGRSGRQAWLIVLACFLALSLSYSYRGSIAIGMPVWEKELGWSRDAISAWGALSLGVMAVTFPLGGVIVDRFGATVVLAGGSFLLAVGVLLVALMGAGWEYGLGYGILGGLGFALVAIPVVSVVVARAFPGRAGLATGIASSGSTAGQFLMLPLLTFGFGAIGWRWSFGWFAALIGVAAVLLFLTLKALEGALSALPPKAANGDSMFTAWGRLFRDGRYHALFWSFVLCGFTTTGVIETHFVPFAIACGFAPMASTLAYSVLAAFNLVGLTGVGWLSDRMNRVTLLVSIYVLRGFTFLVLLAVSDDLALLVVFSIVFGMVEYSTFVPTAGIAAATFGVQNLGKAMGLMMGGHSIGAALGAYFGGWVYVSFTKYDWAWIVSLGVAMTAALVVSRATDPRGRAAVTVPA